MNIGSKIKLFRLKRGLTQKQLGDLCGMADSAIRRYESNRGNPTEKTLQRIATALDVSVLDLMGSDLMQISAERTISKGIEASKAWEDRTWLEENGGSEEEIKEATKRWALSMAELSELSSETALLAAFYDLNDKGKETAIDRVRELAKIPEYQMKKSQDEEEESSG